MATFNEVREVKRRHSADLLKTPGVCGIDIDTDVSGAAVLVVHLDTHDPSMSGTLPDQLDGVPVRYVYTGPVRKLA
jgi:hypothetical protein